MHEPRDLRASIAALVAAGLCLAACLGQGAQASPGQLLKARLAAFGSARSVYLAGSVALQNVSYGITLYEDDDGNAEGGVTLDQKSISVTWNGGRLFLRNPDYLAAQHLYVGSLWVLTVNDALAPVISRLVNRRALVAALTALVGTDVTQRATGKVDGVDTVQLSNNRISATVPTAGGAPVRLATALDVALSDGLSDLKLTVTASSKPQQAMVVPTSYVDLANKNTLPAHFEEVAQPDTFHFEQCDDGGCTLSEDFHNLGGRDGTASATFTVEVGSKQVGSCTVNIPAADNGGTAHAGCRVNWDATAGDAEESVDIINPA